MVEQNGEAWDTVSSYFVDRSDVQCQHRWTKVVNPQLVKGPWTKEVSYVHLLTGPWRTFCDVGSISS